MGILLATCERPVGILLACCCQPGAEIIVRFIDDQAFLWSYELAPRPPPLPPPSVSKLDQEHT
jgi:hypothetical protein